MTSIVCEGLRFVRANGLKILTSKKYTFITTPKNTGACSDVAGSILTVFRLMSEYLTSNFLQWGFNHHIMTYMYIRKEMSCNIMDFIMPDCEVFIPNTVRRKIITTLK